MIKEALEIPVERAKTLLDYDADTGVLVWKVNRCNVRAGTPAGCPDGKGYLMVGIDRTLYRVHRVVYAMVHGWCPPFLDHIDGNPLNNRIENLRPATLKQNARNMSRRKDNTSKHTGVGWHKNQQKWRAYIAIDGKQIHLGSYTDKDAAIAARLAAEKTYHKEYARHMRD